MYMCLKWKRIVLVFLGFMIYYTIRIRSKFDVPFVFMPAIVMTSIIFSIICAVTSRKIKDILKLIQKNKELTATMKAILQIFPEAVIINTLDKDSQKNSSSNLQTMQQSPKSTPPTILKTTPYTL
jgi:hypothetical protein